MSLPASSLFPSSLVTKIFVKFTAKIKPIKLFTRFESDGDIKENVSVVEDKVVISYGVLRLNFCISPLFLSLPVKNIWVPSGLNWISLILSSKLSNESEIPPGVTPDLRSKGVAKSYCLILCFFFPPTYILVPSGLKSKVLTWSSAPVPSTSTSYIFSQTNVVESQGVVNLNWNTATPISPAPKSLFVVTNIRVPSGLNSIAWGNSIWLSSPAPLQANAVPFGLPPVKEIVAVLMSNGLLSEYSIK